MHTEIRHALRSLTRRPRFFAVAAGTLAVGIAAATAVFSLLQAVLLTPLPFANPGDLVLISHRHANTPGRHRIPAPDVDVLRTAPEFTSVAWMRSVTDGDLTGSDGPGHVREGMVTDNLFDVLGVNPAAGRTFRPGEGAVPVDEDSLLSTLIAPVVISHEFWTRRFGASSEILGTRLTLNGGPIEIVGVLPPDFAVALPADLGADARADLWRPVPIPLASFRRIDRLRDRDSDNTGVVLARLAPDATDAAVHRRVEAITSLLRSEHRFYAEAGISLVVERLSTAAVADVRPIVVVLSVAVTLVLLVACLNVAGLFLARAVERDEELAVRSALGASTARLVVSQLAEGGLIAVAGGVVGLIGAVWLMSGLHTVAPDGLLPGITPGIRLPTVVFALAATVVAAMLTSSVAALRARRIRSILSLGSRSLARRVRGRRPLVAAQIGVSFALLIVAGLLIQSVNRLKSVSPGFDANRALVLGIAIRGDDYPSPASRARLLDRVHGALATLPGVSAVGTVAGLPLSGLRWTQPWGLDGEQPDDWNPSGAAIRPITSNYFRAIGTRLLAGRTFTPQEDLIEERRVVVVDRRVARRVAPDGSAIGRHIMIPLDGAPARAEIVGIVETVHQHGLRTAGPAAIYVPYRQEASRQVTVVVRTTGNPMASATRVTDAVHTVDPRLPVFDVRPLTAYVSGAMAGERFALSLIAAFGTLGLGLALVGLYATIAYAVRQRRPEFGIRRALGASDGQIAGIVLRDGLGLAFAGLAVGIALAVPAVGSVGHLMFRVSPLDPPTWIAVAGGVVAATVAATWVPARAARRSPPMAALRQD